MTFDLHLDPKDKQGEYTSWVNRILSVSTALELSYFDLWQIPEHEFEMLENIAREMREKARQKSEQLRETING